MHKWWTGLVDVIQTAERFLQRDDARPVIGLALSGGAERGLAHIGVLAVLEENGIYPDVIAGTSAGSIIGALAAAGWESQQILETARAIQWGKIRRFNWANGMGILKSDAIEEWMLSLLGDVTFDALKRPFVAVAADLLTGEEIRISTGSVASAVRASCAIPGIFTPIQTEEGRLLVDGGIVNNLPIDVAFHLGATYVIGVDVSSHSVHSWPTEAPKNLIDVLNMTYYVLRRNTDQPHGGAQCLVTPMLPNAHLAVVAKYADQFYEIGREAMLEQLPNLLADLSPSEQ